MITSSKITVREAQLEDATVLLELWVEQLRRVDPQEQISDVEQIIKSATASAEKRLMIADYAGEFAGAVLLEIGPVTALNPDLAVRVISPRVLPAMRRHGIGRVLIEQGVALADQHGITWMMTGAEASSRDDNRFLARSGFPSSITLRVGQTSAVRAKVAAGRATRSVSGRTRGRPLSQVLAVRRSMRRSHQASEDEGRAAIAPTED